jgi:hypothetical protein
MYHYFIFYPKPLISSLHIQGRLEQETETAITISFFPKKPQIYKAIIPVYLNDQTKTMYSSIDITGQGVLPVLLFEPKEVILPPVPLDFEVSRTVFIRNVGYGYE